VLKSDGIDQVEVVQLDVTNLESVQAARTVIGGKTPVLYVLVNNAEISGGFPQWR
jgi:NAD(P)-dependent dehydrogenase (short-subunit alcohol dehydrogenase family)